MKAHRRPLVRSLLALLATTLGAITGCDSSDPTDVGAALRLTFTVQPDSVTTAGTVIAPSVQVTVKDNAGNTISDVVPVTITMGSNANEATLSGTTTVNSVDGVATFKDLSIERAGSGYTLVASSGSLLIATSASFTIAPAERARLAFVVQPDGGISGRALDPGIQVAVQDRFGNTVTSATDSISLSIGANPQAAALTGTLKVAASEGIATFADVRISRPGNGFTVGASAGNLPIAASTPFSVTQVVAVVTARSYSNTSCWLLDVGSVYCWGRNDVGQFGNGKRTSVTHPVPAGGGMDFTSISLGSFHSCGVAASGSAYCWGYNGVGQLGDGTRTTRDSAQALAGSFTAIVAGGEQTCGLSSTTTTTCWGRNNLGQLGLGTTGDASDPTPVAGSLRFASLSTNATHTCGIATVTYCWGGNEAGQLGDGTTADRSTPTPVVGGSALVAVSAGLSHTCGLDASGTAYCWGDNAQGALGDGTLTNRSTPVSVATNLRFRLVSAGSSYTCGIDLSGAAWCWGNNPHGELGNGTTGRSLTPVPVNGGLAFSSLSAGGDHVCGLATTDEVYCWGANGWGGLGDGTKTDRWEPVAVQ